MGFFEDLVGSTSPRRAHKPTRSSKKPTKPTKPTRMILDFLQRVQGVLVGLVGLVGFLEDLVGSTSPRIAHKPTRLTSSRECRVI